MLRIGILGAIGSGKSFIAKNFGFPVFNADNEVAKIYKKNKRIFLKLKKILPQFFYSFPIDKREVSKAILANESNLNKIIKIIHFEVKKEMRLFLKKNKFKKFVILDIPLLLENKINNKKDILVFVQSENSKIIKRLKKRGNYNRKLIAKFKSIQLPLDYKKKKSKFIIKNNFTKKSVRKDIKKILKEIL